MVYSRLDRIISLHLTSNCFLKCNHCYQQSFPNDELSEQNIDKFVQLTNPEWIYFYGGEPTLKSDLALRVMKRYPNVKYQIYTNGILDVPILEQVDKIVITLESFFYNEAVKFRPYSMIAFNKVLDNVKKYQSKVEILHNIYPNVRSDKYFYDVAYFLGLTVQIFPMMLYIEELKFFNEPEMLKKLIRKEVLIKPKLRMLPDGTVTRDMRGKYNIGHIDSIDLSVQDCLMPRHDKCIKCKYSENCFFYKLFPHFCYDILNVLPDPHFCKYTRKLNENVLAISSNK